MHRTIRLPAHDVLKATNRDISDKGYAGFKAALTCLRSAEIQTNITTGGVEQWEVFGFIDAAKTIRKSCEGRMLAVEVTLSDGLFNAIDATRGDILTISRNISSSSNHLNAASTRLLAKAAARKTACCVMVWKSCV